MATAEHLDTDVIVWLLSRVLAPKALAKLAGRLGWEQPGTRLTTVPPPELAGVVMRDWKDPVVRQIRYQPPAKLQGKTWMVNWDIGIAVDILTQANGPDVIVLASGDGDFLPLLTYCKRRGIRMEITAFPGSDSTVLAIAANAYHALGPDVLWRSDANTFAEVPRT